MGDDENRMPTMTSGFWFDEGIVEDALTLRMRLTKVMHDEQSSFQRVQIIETAPFGKTLVLDGKTQSTLLDEAIYHESLVHPALLQHPCPKRVYIGGGGELATARECLRHSTVEEVVMVDLDEMVVDMCKQHMEEWNCGSTEDPRLNLIIGDARAHLLENDSKYDVVVLDISDPIEAGPAVHLYTKEFYDLVKTKLNPGGIVVTQSGPAGVFNYDECFTAIHNTLKSSFRRVYAYSTSIPSFGSEWGFNVAWSDDDDDTFAAAENTDAKISERIKGGHEALKHYDAQTHRRMLNLSKIIRQGLANETRLITEDNPVFMY